MAGGLLGEAFNYAVELLKELISIPTVSPAGDNYEKAANLLARELEKLGFSVDVVEVDWEYQKRECKTASDKPRYIVIGRLGDSGRVLHVNGHYDVVPGGPGWSVTEPFKPVVRDGRLYGRGAIDMKGGIAAAIAGIKLALDRGYRPKDKIIEMAFVPDEEIGGKCGTGYLVEKVLEKIPEYVIIPEPSGLDTPWHGHKGALWAEVRVYGKTAHASTPWKGINAFTAGARLALELEKAYSVLLSNRRTNYKITPPDAVYSTFMIGGVAGVPEGKTNQVPGEFRFTIDRRLIPEETVENAKAELEGLVKWISASLGIQSYSIIYKEEMPPVVSEPGELYEALRRAALKAGVEVKEPEICPGGLDLRYYVEKGSKALSYGPKGDTAHAPDEFIELDELEKLVHIFANLYMERL